MNTAWIRETKWQLELDKYLASEKEYRDKIIRSLRSSVSRANKDYDERSAGFFQDLIKGNEEQLKTVSDAVAHLRKGHLLFESVQTDSPSTTNGVFISYAFVHPSGREPDKIQVTIMDRMGPYTHFGPGTIERETIGQMLSRDFRPSMKTSFDFSRQGAYVDDAREKKALFPCSTTASTPRTVQQPDNNTAKKANTQKRKTQRGISL